MMKEIIEVTALFLGFVGWILISISLQDQYWKESTTEGSVITTSTIYENLWMSCASDSTGIYNCRDFPSLFALPASLLWGLLGAGLTHRDFGADKSTRWCKKIAWTVNICNKVVLSLDNTTRVRRTTQGNMNAIVEAMAFFLGFLGWLMVGVALPNRYWKVSSVDGNVITTSTIYENLWMSCATDSTGVHNCRDFPSLLALNGYIQASRALMIAAIVFGTFGIVATLVGMQCSKIGGENYVLKGRIAAIGGVFFLLQGICTMIAISWYAANITREFFDQFYPGTKYEIGEGLYIGWSSAVLSMCGGACLLCACKLQTDSEKMQYPHQPPARGYLLSTVAPSQTAPSNYGRNAYV